jgi:hypothetical protein
MIPVVPAKEPTDFDAKVRQPGLSAIDEMVGRPPRLKRSGRKRKQLLNAGLPVTQEQNIPAKKFPHYWRKALPEMLVLYERRCAYLAMYINHATGNASVDHLLPKSYAWDQVYEWDNYRLCAEIINSKKGVLLTLVDPFTIGPDWFRLNMNTFYVGRGLTAPKAEWPRIDATLPVLNQKLCVEEREEYVTRYLLGPGAKGIDLTYLEHRAPFIAAELRRQGCLVRGDT